MQPIRRRRTVFFVVIIFAVLVLICGLTLVLARSAIMGDRREPQPERDGVRVHTLAALPGDRAYPEAISVGPDGNLYVSSFCTGDIWQITPGGELNTWYRGQGIEAASGLAFGPDGALYVADRGSCNPRKGTASVKRIAPDGQTVERVGNVDRNDIPNALAFDSAGTLFLTDTQQGAVRWLTEAERFETWWTLPEVEGEKARPTGLAYDSVNDAMIVADTASGSIYRVGFDDSRNPGPPEVLYRQDSHELDGLTVDDQGRVLVTLFNANRVARLEADGRLVVLASDFREPSDVACVAGVVYVTNFDSLALAPVVGLLIDPSLPFTVDAIDLSDEAGSG